MKVSSVKLSSWKFVLSSAFVDKLLLSKLRIWKLKFFSVRTLAAIFECKLCPVFPNGGYVLGKLLGPKARSSKIEA